MDDGSSHGERQQSVSGAFGRNAFGQGPGNIMPMRDTDSPFRSNRNMFEDFTPGSGDDYNGTTLGQTTASTLPPSLAAVTSLSMGALNHTRNCPTLNTRL